MPNPRTALVALIVTLAPLSAEAAPMPTKVQSLTQRYLDGLFRAKPHLATFMGEHRYDGKLPDFSDKALAAREAELSAQLAELKKIPTAGLSKDDEVDLAILADGITLERLYLSDIRDWEWDPRFNDSFPVYDPRDFIAGRLADIVHGDYAPEADRRRDVIAQLEAMPAFIAQKRERLLHPTGKRHTPKVYAEHAIKGNPGNIEFFETEVKAFVGKDPRGEVARKKVVEALRAYQTFLEKDLLTKADGDWRLGADLYAKKFTPALQTDRTPAQVLPEAEAAFKKARAELYSVARKLHKQLWPKEAEPAAGADAKTQAQVMGRVRDELAKDHPKPAELVQAHGRNLDALRAFIQKHDLLELPPKETLLVEPMPAFKRGSSAAEYLAPGVLIRKPVWHATYYVDPIDPTWPEDKVESYLRGQNDYEVQLVAAHEAYPGHHTQYFYSKRNLNPLRAVLWNASMVEGWAVYGEGLMVALGWGGPKNDAFRFYDLRGQMIVAANTILDIKLQSGLMTDEEAVRFMVDEGFQEKAMAEKKLLRAKLDSTQLVQYFLGLDEINALERDYKKKVGSAYKQRTFNEALIGHGSVAVKFLRRYVLDK